MASPIFASGPRNCTRPERDLVVREPFLQRRFGVALQCRVDGRVHRVGLGGQAGDAVRLRLAAEKINEVQTAVASRLRESDELRRRRQRAVLVCSAEMTPSSCMRPST